MRIHPQANRPDNVPLAQHVRHTRYAFVNNNSAPLDEQAFQLIVAGKETCLPDYWVSDVEVDFYVLEFVISGHGKGEFRNETRSLSAGSLLCYQLDERHCIYSDPQLPMTKYFAVFRASYLWKIEVDAKPSSRVTEMSDTPTLVQGLFEELLCHAGRQGNLAIAVKCLELILLKRENYRPCERADETALTADRYHSVRRVIEEHSHELQSVDQIAARASLTRRQLFRLFRRFSHDSPLQCLLNSKLRLAAELIATENQSITSIAGQVGFEDPNYFSRLFKRHFGKAPTEIRKGN